MRSIFSSAIACLGGAAAVLVLSMLPVAAETPSPAATDGVDGFRIAQPAVHDNLAIYLIHGPSHDGPVPLTLQEALEQKRVTVRETGVVNTLEIENSGDQDVFIQAGDIVKGGQQDRMLTASLLVPAHSGAVPIASFCVEQSRWSRRGTEDPTQFTSANMALQSLAARKILADSNSGSAGAVPVASAQSRVWNEVATIQDKLTRSLKNPVQAPRSSSSLQLSLENGELAQAEQAYLAAFDGLDKNDTDVVGYAIAVNGRIASADIYASNGLFRKLWPKLLRASVAEAIGERTDATAVKAPASDAVGSFLAAAPKSGGVRSALPANNSVDVRKNAHAIVQETRPAAAPAAPAALNAGWMHRSYLAN